MKKCFCVRLSAILCMLLMLAAACPWAMAAESYTEPGELIWGCGDYEWQVLALTNKERMAQGLLPLSGFDALQQAVHERAGEVTEYFSHTRPDGTACYTALDAWGVSYFAAAENIAKGQTSPQAVVTAWMNSAGHRANILNGNLVHGGMGYNSDGNGWVQMFVSRSCSITAMELIPGSRGYMLPMGKTLDDLGMAVRLTCSVHGSCYLPLIEEMCSAVDTTQEGSVSVKASYGSLSRSFTLQVYESTDGTYTEGDFTAEVVDGKATITGWSGVNSWWSFADVTVPATICGFPVVKIGDGVFAETYLNAVVLPEGLEEIGDGAFRYSYVSSINLPESLKTIGAEAFYGTDLTGTVKIPASVEKIGTYAFAYLRYATAFEVAEDNAYYCSVDGVLFNKSMTTLWNYPAAKADTSYVVPSTVKLLYCTSFAYATNLKNLYVYSPVVSAMTYTFYGCSSELVIWCKPGTTLYTQLTNSGFAVKALPYRSVDAAANAITVTLADQFVGGNFFLAAYSQDGRLLQVRTLSGQEVQTVVLPGTDSVGRVLLFHLDENFAPTAGAETLWSAADES